MDLLNELRYHRGIASSGLWRGGIPRHSLPMTESFQEAFFRSMVLGFLTWIIVYGVALFFNLPPKIQQLAPSIGITIFLLTIFRPYLIIIFNAIWQFRKPNFASIETFSDGQRWLANIALGFFIAMSIQSIYPYIRYWWNEIIIPSNHSIYQHTHLKVLSHVAIYKPSQTDYLSIISFLVLWVLLTLLIYGLVAVLSQRNQTITSRSKQRYSKYKALNQPHHIPFGLWLGKSTGKLATLSHQANLATSQHVGLFNDDLAQNILVLGAIGSGKTTRAIHPFLLQLLDQQCGGLIFDIKGDFHKAVETFTSLTKRSYQRIGPGQQAFNLLSGLTPEIAASFLKSAFLVAGNQQTDSFWIDTATELCRNALGTLSFLPTHYTLHGLYCYLFDPEWRDQILAKLQSAQQLIITKNEQRLLASYQRYETHIFETFDEKVKAGVKATIAQIISPFSHPELLDAFCTTTTEDNWLEKVLDGNVFLIDLPLARWGLGAKVVYLFIKLLFFNIMQQRVSRLEWNQKRYVFFLCDEYQEIVSANRDGLSDLNFWDKSRSSKTIGIISAQSVSSFYAAIGNRDVTHALLQNFRQKICFRTEDQNTIEMMNRLLGTVEISRITYGQSSGSTSGQSSSSHTNTNMSINLQDKPLLSGQFFRGLSTDMVLAILSSNGMGFDDVLQLQPFYI